MVRSQRYASPTVRGRATDTLQRLVKPRCDCRDIAGRAIRPHAFPSSMSLPGGSLREPDSV